MKGQTKLKRHFKSLLNKDLKMQNTHFEFFLSRFKSPLNTHSKSFKPKINKHFKISLLKTCFISLLCLNSAFGANIQDYQLPSNITLSAGEQRTDTAISSSSSWEAKTFYYNSGLGASLSVNGGASSKYTLKIDDDKTTFYANSFTIGQNANLELNHFHTINFAGNVNVGTNAEFTILNSGNTLTSAQGSEYGKRSKIRFGNKNANFILGENSRAFFSYTLFFMSDAKLTLGANSSLQIISANATRFQNTFTNNGGTATFGGMVGNTMVNTNVYNIGSPTSSAVNAKNTTATFTNNSGNIVVNGDFYNGGQAVTDVSGAFLDTYDPPFGGGGNLVLNGGTMRVTGKLVSQRGGTEYYGGELGDIQNSSISIYGATLIVGGGLQNKEGSTLTFGLRNSVMGVLQGDLSNQNGVVSVDLSGVSVGQSYQIITGAVSGLDGVSFFNNPNPTFLTATYSNGSVSITQTSGGGDSGGSGGTGGGDSGGGDSGGGTGDSGGGSGGGTSEPTDFDKYKATLNPLQNSVLNALSQKLGGDDAVLTGIADIAGFLSDSEKEITNLQNSPKALLNAFKGDILLSPLKDSKHFSRRLFASSGAVRLDTGARVGVWGDSNDKEIYVQALGGALKASDIDGYLAGASLGVNFSLAGAATRVHFAFAQGKSTQDLATQSTDTTAKLFSVGILTQFRGNIFESEANANALFGRFEIATKSHANALLSSNANFNNYQANAGVNVGVRLGKALSFKPFVGLQGYFEKQDDFTQSKGLELAFKGYNAFVLDANAGAEGRYEFWGASYAFVRGIFETRAYNSHRTSFVRVGAVELDYENESYKNTITAHFGLSLSVFEFGKSSSGFKNSSSSSSASGLNIDIEVIYKKYDSLLNYYGGSLAVKYRF